MEDYLGRDASPLSEEFWKRLDEAVVETAKETLTARRFLPLYGPLGPGVQVAPTDSPVREEKTENGFTFSPRRSFVEVPQQLSFDQPLANHAARDPIATLIEKFLMP